jgi:hypothetical protein
MAQDGTGHVPKLGLAYESYGHARIYEPRQRLIPLVLYS